MSSAARHAAGASGRRTLAARAALALAAATGCALGPDGGDELDPQLTEFIVTATNGDLVYDDRGQPRPGAARVDAILEFGVDGSGQRRTPATDSLRVGDTTVARGTRLPNSHRWTAVVPRAPTDAPLRIPVPAVGGTASTIEAVVLSAPARVGGDTVAVVAGEPIRLALRLPTAASIPAPSERSWWISVRPAGSTTEFVSLGGAGLPPAELVVPAELLPPAGPENAYQASFEYREGAAVPSTQPAPATYRVRYSASTRFTWQVVVAPRPTR